jgi:hypothetical protein
MAQTELIGRRGLAACISLTHGLVRLCSRCAAKRTLDQRQSIAQIRLGLRGDLLWLLLKICDIMIWRHKRQAWADLEDTSGGCESL